MKTTHSIVCKSFTLRKLSAKGGGEPLTHAETYPEAQRVARTLASFEGEPIQVFPCIECLALIEVWTEYPGGGGGGGAP